MLPRLTSTSVRYMECLKNHAASTGGHAVDGCREFMAAGEEGTPGSLKCAACSCHRNFHRKETSTIHHHHHHHHHHQLRPPPLPTMQQQHNNNHHHHHHHCCSGTPVPLLPGAPVESSSAEALKSLVSSEQSGGSKEKKKRRFRTKFTQEQKDGMYEFAEKIGWRMKKEDEEEVQRFCRQVGLKRDVFKVWIHNTKQAEKKKKKQL